MVSLYAALSLFATFLFFGVMFFTKMSRNKAYIVFILLAFPLMQLDMVPGRFSVSTFDLITYIFLFFFYERKETTKLMNGGLYLFLFILILFAAIIGSFNAKGLSQDTAIEFISVVSTFAFAGIVIGECQEDNTFFYTILKCLRIALITSLVFLAGQFIFGVEFSIAKVQNPNVMEEGTRYTSYFQDPQKYSQFLAALSFLLLIKPKGVKKISIVNYGLLVISIVGILFTGGRAGFGGWCLGLFILLLFSKSSYRFAYSFIGGILALIMLNYKEHFSFFHRASLDESYEFRYDLWKDAFKIFLNHPCFGIGLGNYANYVSVHNPDQYWLVENQISYFDHPESGYLKILTELGVLGFAAFFLIILIPLIKTFFLFIKTKDLSNLLLVCSVASWMVGFYTVYSFSDVRLEILVITLVCLLITSYNRVPLKYAQ